MVAIYSAYGLTQLQSVPKVVESAPPKPPTRRIVIRNKEFMQRQRIDSEREALYAELTRMWLDGCKGAVISRELKVSESWVTNHARKLGLPPRYKTKKRILAAF